MISRLCGMATAWAASRARNDVFLVDDAPGDAHHAAAVDRGNVRAGQADQGGGDLHAGSAFGFFDRARDGLRGCLDIDDRAFADALRRLNPDAQDAQAVVTFHARDQGANLGGADINSNDDRFFSHGVTAPIDSKVRPGWRR